MLRVWGDVYSGNCFKVKLLLTQLRLAFEWIHINVLERETRTAAFLAMNPTSRPPASSFATCSGQPTTSYAFRRKWRPATPRWR